MKDVERKGQDWNRENMKGIKDIGNFKGAGFV